MPTLRLSHNLLYVDDVNSAALIAGVSWAVYNLNHHPGYLCSYAGTGSGVEGSFSERITQNRMVL